MTEAYSASTPEGLAAGCSPGLAVGLSCGPGGIVEVEVRVR